MRSPASGHRPGGSQGRGGWAGRTGAGVGGSGPGCWGYCAVSCTLCWVCDGDCSARDNPRHTRQNSGCLFSIADGVLTLSLCALAAGSPGAHAWWRKPGMGWSEFRLWRTMHN